jgi:hypothetical protein
MSKETFYFLHDCKARHDRKLVNLIMQHGMVGVGVYWCVVEMLYEEGGYLPLKYDSITFELRTDTNVIRSVINDFELFENDGVNFYSNSVLDRLKERCNKSEKARCSINKRWKRLGKNTNVIRSKTERNTIKKRIEKNSIEYTDDFSAFYYAYPKHVAKPAAFKAFKNIDDFPGLSIILSKIEEFKRSDAWVKDNGKFIPHPATWLNGRRWEDEIKVGAGSW